MGVEEDPDIIRFDARHFDHLVNVARDFAAAKQYCEEVLRRSHGESLELLQSAILAELLNGGAITDNPAKKYLKIARQLDGWDGLKEGDVIRDVAIQAIRSGDAHTSLNLLDEAYPLHRNDMNRLACLLMVEGRAHYMLSQTYAGAKGRVEMAKAIDHLTAAQRLWKRIGDAADDQWVNNGRVHLMIALVDSGQRIPLATLRPFLLTEKNLKKRVAALILFFGGRMGLAQVQARA